MSDEKKGEYDAKARKIKGRRKNRKDATVKTIRDVYGLDHTNGRIARSNKKRGTIRKKK